MSKSRGRISSPFFVLLLAISLFLDGERFCKAIRVRNSNEADVCDDGKVKISSRPMLQSMCCVSISLVLIVYEIISLYVCCSICLRRILVEKRTGNVQLRHSPSHKYVNDFCQLY